jgi:hypothetical protein
MSFRKKMLALAAPAALLALSACTTGMSAQVQRFQAMPAPQGQSFVIKAANPANNGGLEFSQYAELVRQHLLAQGYSEAPTADDATLVVSLDYGVDDGRERVVSYPDPFGYGFGYGHGYWPGRYGYWGRGYYWGWNDPWMWGGYGGYDTHSYTVYTSYLDLDIRRSADGQSLFEGLAQAHSRNNELPLLVPNLVEAMFTGFPGNSGETVRITVDPERQQASSGY